MGIWRHKVYYTIFLLFCINLINYLDRYLVAGSLASIKNEMQLSDTQCGGLATAFMIVYMTASPLFGWLGDRWIRKYLIASGVFLWSWAAGSTYFVTHYIGLLLCRGLSGIGESSYATTAPTVIADLVPQAKRGMALSFFYMAIPIGSALGFMIGGWVGGNYNWRYGFMGSGAFGLLLAVLAIFMHEPQRGESDNNQAKKQPMAWKQALPYLAKNKSFVFVTLGLITMSFVMGGLAIWMPIFFERCRHVPQDQAGLYFGGITVIAGFLGTFAGGVLGDKLQKKHSGAYFAVCSVSMLLSLPFGLVCFLVPQPYIYWPALFLAEFFIFLNTGPGNTIIANVIPASLRVTAFAVNTFCIHALGDAISPAIIGLISDFLQTKEPSFFCKKMGFFMPSNEQSLVYAMCLLMPLVMIASSYFFYRGIRHLGQNSREALGSLNEGNREKQN